MDNSKSQIEIERKYIIAIPNDESYFGLSEYSRSEIKQIYLDSPVGITHRVRARTTLGISRYYETTKVRIDKCSSHEIEREISENEFLKLLDSRDQKRKAIEKTRHAFTYKGQLFEIDVYPEWNKTCILETELDTREREVEFPSFIHIVREVTGEREYSNAAMARSFPPEDKI